MILRLGKTGQEAESPRVKQGFPSFPLEELYHSLGILKNLSWFFNKIPWVGKRTVNTKISPILFYPDHGAGLFTLPHTLQHMSSFWYEDNLEMLYILPKNTLNASEY